MLTKIIFSIKVKEFIKRKNDNNNDEKERNNDDDSFDKKSVCLR